MTTDTDGSVQLHEDDDDFVVTVRRGHVTRQHRFRTRAAAMTALIKNGQVCSNARWKPPALRAFVAEWLREYVTTECAASTYRDYEHCSASLVVPRLGDLALNQISKGRVGVFVAELMAEEGIGAMILGRRTLSAMLGVAEKWGYISRNPVSRFNAD